MIRCSCQGLHGCVPVAASAIPRPSASSKSCWRRSARSAAASSKSRSGRCGPRPPRRSARRRGAPRAACPSRRPGAPRSDSSATSVSGSRTANSSSTATVKSPACSNCSRAKRICSSGLSRWESPIPATLVKGAQQSSARRCASSSGARAALRAASARARALLRAGARAARSSLARGRRRRPSAKLARSRCSGGYSASSPSAISARPECRATSGGQPAAAASAATIPNASGKIDGTTAASASGEQVDEVAVLEGAGEERPRRRGGLELGPVVAEADDHGLRLEPLQRLEQQVDALVPQELAEVDDRRALRLEEGGETVGVALVRQALVGVSRVRRVAARLVEQAPRAPRRAAWGRNSSTSTPGGTSCTRSTWPTTSSTTRRMCAEPTKTASAPASASRPHAESSALPRIEYSSSEPCALTA